MKFLIDMALSPQLALWLSGQGHDAVHARDLELNRAPDSEIVEIARNEGRIVITADLDYPRILALTRAEKPGLILFRGGNYSQSEAIERLARALELVPSEELESSIIVIEKDRIRRRRLPLELGL